ncbi:MAG: PQQ-binding-like beta-propeller repeat protein [Verrucomicrobiota bacterium]
MKPLPFPSSVLPLLATLLLFAPLLESIAQDRPPRRGLPELAEAVTSFGAAVSGEYLYVYSGHMGSAHEFTNENYSTHFRRLNLFWAGDWEELKMQDPVQGHALVPWEGAVYRLGGIFSHNAPGEDTDMRSTDVFAKFDGESASWTPLTPLPEPRSSFDAAVHDGRVYLIGGWTLDGDPFDAEWLSTNYVADLSAETITWEALPEAPFVTRALAVAATDKFVYAIGGMTDDDSPSNAVYRYDPAAKSWSEGPETPEKGGLKGFGASAFGVGSTLWASGASGRVYALEDGSDEWRDTGTDLETDRFFHRLLPDGKGNLLFLGGTNKEGYLSSIESLDLTLLEAQSSARKVEGLSETSSASEGETTWTGFRGSGASLSQAKDLPLDWSDEKNIAWNVEIDGYGQSSPIVWEDRIFVTSMQGDNKETIKVDCFALKTGEVLWSHSSEASQKVEKSMYVSQSAPTPVVDESAVYAFFESGDVLAFSHAGELKWTRSLTKEYGDFAGNHGVGSSPTLTSTGLVILIDHDAPSYLVCLDPATGDNVWKSDREQRVSWSSPVAASAGEDERIVISSNGIVESYDAESGERLWYFEGVDGNTVSSPTVAEDLVIIGSSKKRESRAFALDGSGDVSESPPAWVAEDSSSSFGSPLVHDGYVYFVNRAGVAFCNDLETGERMWSLRLPASCWASPIGSGDRVYFFSTNGTTTILQANPEEPVELGVSSLLTETKVYGVAAVDENLIFRMESRLICVRDDAE